MSRLFRHILIPSVVPLIFFAIALTPVEMFGCRGRGLLAFGVAFSSGGCAIAMAFTGLKLRLQGNPGAAWWMLSTIVLTIPVVALLAAA